jgi:hypothetical protein
VYSWAKVKGRLLRKSIGYTVGARKAEEHARRVAAQIEYKIRSKKAGWSAPTVREYWLKTYRPSRTVDTNHQIAIH